MANDQQSSDLDSGKLTSEDIYDYLSDDKNDKKEASSDEKDEKVGDEEEGDEEKTDDDKDDEEEIVLKEEDEEKTEDEEDEDKIDLVKPFKKKELLAKYPNILKEFPHLEKSYYRDQQFTEVFPTPAEAKQAAETVEVFQDLQRDLSNGDARVLIGSLKENDTKAYRKFVDNYLTSLRDVDQDAHLHVIGTVVKNLIISMGRESQRTNNPELKRVAAAINKYAFDSEEFIPPVKLSEQGEEENEVQKEKEDWNRQRFEETRDDLDNRVDNVLKSTITDYMDPKQLMTDYVKRTAIKEAIEEVKTLLDKDTAFRKQLDALWKRAFDTGFDLKSKNAIKSAYLSKARTVMPQVIKKHRIAALKGLGRRVRETKEEDTDKKGHAPVHRSSTSSTNRGQKKSDIPKGMTTLEFLNQD